MTNSSLPIIAPSLLPEGTEAPSHEDSILFIGQLFSWPVMQSLIRLNPNARSDRLYHSWTNPLTEVWKVASLEDWEEKIVNFQRRAPNWLVSFGTDCSKVQEVLQSLDQLRLLWDNQLITTEAFRVIFAEMCENWKTSHKELTLDDGERLDYDELQMQFMIQYWIAVQWFTNEMRERLTRLLH